MFLIILVICIYNAEVVVAHAVVVDVAVVPNREHIQNRSLNLNLNRLNVVVRVQNPSEYLVFLRYFSMSHMFYVISYFVLFPYIYFDYFIFFLRKLSIIPLNHTSVPIIIGSVFGLATCLELLSRLLTLTRVTTHRELGEQTRVSLYFILLLSSV